MGLFSHPAVEKGMCEISFFPWEGRESSPPGRWRTHRYDSPEQKQRFALDLVAQGSLYKEEK